MLKFRPLVAAVLIACAAPFTQAVAAPCAGFTDVDSTSPYCPNVEWIKNRLVTLGCSANQYCPDAMVVRLSMAAFMNRLGVALTPTPLDAEGAPGAVDLDLTPVVCQTPDYAVANFPRRADVDVSISGTAAVPVSVSGMVVMSLDGGGSWTPLSVADSRTLMGGAGGWGNMTQLGSTDLDVGQTVRLGLRLGRVGTGATNLTDSRCQIKTMISSRNGASSPF
jgi:hypothetical protein